MSDFEDIHRQWRALTDHVANLRKLFLVGWARSGTTWLMNCLQGHDQIVINGEGRFIWQFAPLLEKAVAGFNLCRSPDQRDHITSLRQIDLDLLTRTVIESQLGRYIIESPQKPDLRIVGDKTPQHTLAIPKLHHLFPGARFINIIRDPRDAAVSQWLFRARHDDSRSFEEFMRHSITKGWPLNVLSARHAGQNLGDGQYVEVRYEDLLTDEMCQLRRLLEFLDVDASDEAIEKCRIAGDFRRRSGGRERGDGRDDKFYRRGVAGDWRNHLPEDLARECCGQIPGLMRAFGYDPEVTEEVDVSMAAGD